MLGCASRGQSEKADLHFEIGRSFYEDGRYPDSIAQFQAALQEDPNRPAALLYLGMAYYKIEHFDDAVKNIQKACGLSEVYPECWNNLAAVELGRGHAREAAAAAQKALSTDTYATPELALANLARAQLLLKDSRSALSNVDKALRLKPEACALRQLRVKVLAHRAEFEAGLNEAQTLVRNCPLDPSSHLWEAYALYKIGRRSEAASKYAQVPKLFAEGSATEESREALLLMKKKIPPNEPKI